MQDLTGYFRGLTKDTCVSGLARVKGANPQYDVLVAAGTPLAEALANSFGVGGGEVEAFRESEMLKTSLGGRRQRRSWRGLFLPKS